MIARDRNERDLGIRKAEYRVEENALGLGCRRAVIKDVAGDNDGVDLLVHRDIDDLANGGFELRCASSAADRPAEVPVGGMQQTDRASQRRSKPAKGSASAPATSSARVAQHGKGNRSWIGIGM